VVIEVECAVKVKAQILPDRFRGMMGPPTDNRSMERLGGCQALVK